MKDIEIISLRGTHMVFSAEADEGRKFSVDSFKRLFSGAKLSCRRPHNKDIGEARIKIKALDVWR